VWARTGLTIPLTMLPFFYQTLWFRLTALVVLLGLVPILVWLRLRQMSRRQAALKHVNAELDERVQARTAELAETYRRLMEASHLAGMAEVATEVLHSVGNVLNSVNVSTNVLSEGLRRSRLGHVVRLSKLLHTQADNLPAFLTVDPRGSRVLPFLHALAGELTAEQQHFLAEVESLQQNVEHIKQIVAMQQSHARVNGVVETVAPIELFEDALRMKGESLARHGVELIREFSPTPAIFVERHKVLQILVNLIQNAKQAILEGPNRSQQLLLRLQSHEEHVRFIITDNGIGIAKENLARIFSHGFTTRAKGHGFGLHSAANAAKQMNGTLQAYSEGAGCGATFILQLPMAKLDGPAGNFDR
jgi:signal transduction histidine kinase